MDSYDLIVIGAGPGGYVCAIRAAQLGLKTALVEKRESLGGTCLNVGCIPSKALLESSELFHVAKEKAADHGVMLENVSLDLAAMMARKRKIVDELTGGLAGLMKKNKITVLKGVGALAGDRTVSVEGEDGERKIEGKAIVLAAGSEPVELPFMKFDGKRVVGSTEALSFEEVPKRLVVVGAGAVGLEMGSVWRRLGAEVTVIEMLPRIAPFADSTAAKQLMQALKKQGLTFLLETKVTEADVSKKGVKLTVENAKGDKDTVEADKVLVSVGRRPFADRLNLDEVGVELDDGKRVKVDEQYRTNVDGVYAIGDLIAGPMLAHKAEDEGVAVAEILAGKPGRVNYEAIPNVVYTWPELAQVGRTEEEVKDAGVEYNVGRFSYRANGRAKTLGDEEGMVKMIADAKTDRLLGCHITGARASDMIAEIALAFEFHASSEDVARTSHAHPTLAEIVKEAAMAVDKRAIHG